jgi:hypothetical protein
MKVRQMQIKRVSGGRRLYSARKTRGKSARITRIESYTGFRSEEQPLSANTSIPATLEKQQAKAESYLDRFSHFTDYQHRGQNPYLNWLKTDPQLTAADMNKFFNIWHPVSRHQPQILLQIAAVFPDWRDRYFIMKNYLEEDGMVKQGDDPHYVLLERLIIELGGKPEPDQEAEELVRKFHESLLEMTAAEATGILAAIEHPALDISDYFQQLTRLCGRSELTRTDPYLYIHVAVEPKHIIWSHGNALDWMEDEEKQRKEAYTKADIVNAYKRSMEFWNEFWQIAFRQLGYRQ